MTEKPFPEFDINNHKTLERIIIDSAQALRDHITYLEGDLACLQNSLRPLMELARAALNSSDKHLAAQASTALGITHLIPRQRS